MVKSSIVIPKPIDPHLRQWKLFVDDIHMYDGRTYAYGLFY